MRTVFFEQLRKEMRINKKLFLIVADMGLGLVDRFQQEFPERFINVGIAEQNMAGIAAGLCNTGFRPVCYTISNFLVQRCFEQLRNDVCLHNYPIIFVGTSTGFDNGGLGPTHHVIDDIGCVKILPDIRIYSPSTVFGMNLAFRDIIKGSHPVYLRIGKGSYDLEIHSQNVNHMVVENSQSDILIITHGNILQNIMEAIGKDRIASIYCMTKIKPLVKDELDVLFKEYSTVVVIEDQLVSSGLYSILCRYVVEYGSLNTNLLSIAPEDCYAERAGDKNYFAEKYGLSSESIHKFILSLTSA